MKKTEHLAEWKNYYHYGVDKIICDDTTHILLLRYDRHPNGVISVIEYPTIGENTSFPLMNWENLFRCSNYYGISPEETDFYNNPAYMSIAVQKHMKPAATLRYDNDSQLIKQIQLALPDDCSLIPYKEENTTFICRKGSLHDFYDLNRVKYIYELFGITEIDWNAVDLFCNKELSFFSDDNISGISIERGAENITQMVVVGLLLGYPIESTVAKINKSEHSESSVIKEQAVQHYKTNTEPFFDCCKNEWLCQNGQVFAVWQQESLYY